MIILFCYLYLRYVVFAVMISLLLLFRALLHTSTTLRSTILRCNIFFVFVGCCCCHEPDFQTKSKLSMNEVQALHRFFYNNFFFCVYFFCRKWNRLQCGVRVCFRYKRRIAYYCKNMPLAHRRKKFLFRFDWNWKLSCCCCTAHAQASSSSSCRKPTDMPFIFKRLHITGTSARVYVSCQTENATLFQLKPFTVLARQPERVVRSQSADNTHRNNKIHFDYDVFHKNCRRVLSANNKFISDAMALP